MTTSPSYNFCVNSQDNKLTVDPIEAHTTNSIWCHFERTEEFRQAAIALGVSEHESLGLFEEKTRPQFNKINKNTFAIYLRGINLNPNSDPEDMVSLRLWCNGEKLISVRNRRVQAISAIRELLNEQAPHISSTADIFCEIIHQLLVRISKHVSKLIDHIENLEEKLDDDKSISASEVHELRRATSRLWRYMYPQLDTIKKLSTFEAEWITDSHRNRFKDFVDTMNFYNEELSLIKERCDILVNEIDGKINNKVNRNLYIISIVTAIFLPLSFLTGLLGINVGGIPAAESPYGFLIVCGIMLGLFIAQVALLRFFRWF